MPGVVTKRFRIHNAEQFYEAFSEAADTKMYLFIARINAWDNGDAQMRRAASSANRYKFNEYLL